MTRTPSLGVSSSERYSVFDFNEDDEKVEKMSEKLLGKFGNSKKRKCDLSSPITKYKFLGFFAGCSRAQEKERGSEPIVVDGGPIDADSGRCARAQEKERGNEPIVLDDGPIDVDSGRGMKTLSEEVVNELIDIDANDLGNSHKPSISLPMCMVQEDGDVKEICCLDAHVPSSSSNDEKTVDMILDDDDEKSEMSSSSISVSTLGEKEVPSKDLVPECCSVGHKIDILNNAVVIFPDFILYDDIYCTESRLTFSSSCISVEGSTVNGAKGSFKAKWAIGDIMSIESEWWGRVETAMLNLSLKSKVSKGSGTANEIPGIDKLKFSVYDPDWFEGQEAIKSLDSKYRDIWNVIFDTDQETDGDAFLGSKNMSIPKPHLYILDETFEEVVYPRGDPDAVSISKRDMELLRPETFINDTIIDFYIKYLKNKIQPEDQHRFHFFNSFFFRKLADFDKDPRSACEGRAAFQRVRKWTKKVNLFEKDYIFIPVNYSLHWSLIVVCHPGDVACFIDDESERALRVPCILHMDSIKGSHRGLKNLIQSYLCEEWKERHNDTPDDVSLKFSRLRFVPLEMPQQANSFDCGLFLLHYVELFLEEAPINFSPFKITEFSNFLNRNWFLPAEASLKRAHIQKLICEILEEQTQKCSQVESTDKHPHSQFVIAGEQETGVEFLTERCCSLEMCRVDSSSLNNELGIEISLPSKSLLTEGWQQVEVPGLDSRKSFEPETSTRKFSRGNYSQMRASRLNFMSPIKEAEEVCEQISDSSSDTEDCCHIVESATEPPTSYIGEDLRSLRTSWTQSYLQQAEELFDDASSSEISTSGSRKSWEIGVDEDPSHPEFEGFGHPTETERQESSSTATGDLATYIVDDSQEENGNDPAQSDGEFESRKNIVRKSSAPMDKKDLVAESDELAVKSSKLTSQESGR
ncbi:probable ubiquitin-like-specific protease 2A isoform X2 [Jatropha curcas]|uniref:probable ubiquitin-like-specific protease 2A isoform X2 n=1 Tax=Jatropha curcas TaxID=180498 RepID=UPI0009D6A4B3|nr:probable ubiquitin-like-specific protease 2A isoform X2 [Jatropha curcas]